jgi:hypothetical protein
MATTSTSSSPIDTMRAHQRLCAQAYFAEPTRANYMMWLSLQDIISTLVRAELRRYRS